MALRYVVHDEISGFDQLKPEEYEVPQKLNPGEVLVKLKAASLNYRDLIITKGLYPLPLQLPVVPGSDGAGIIEKVGEDVEGFEKGDSVVCNFFTNYLDGTPTDFATHSALGGTRDGCFQKYAVLPAHALVHAPKNLSFEEIATLPCAAVTAWNGLFGSKEHQVKPGNNVLVLGTGGVSTFALQFALAAGANVTVTSSSDEKLEFAKKLGATHTINYKKTPQWASPALKMTNGVGYHHVIEVGGEKTLPQSIACLAKDGMISMIGFVANEGTTPNLTSIIGQILNRNANIRGIFVGSVSMFRDMVACIEAKDIHPVVDKVFPFDQLKEAYEYQWSQAHIGKVVLKID